MARQRRRARPVIASSLRALGLTFLIVATAVACGNDFAEDRTDELVETMIDLSVLEAEPWNSERWQGSSSTSRFMSLTGCVEEHPDRDDRWISKSGVGLIQRGDVTFNPAAAEAIAAHFESEGWEVRRQQRDPGALPAIVDAVLGQDTVRVFATTTQYTLSAESGPCAPFNVREPQAGYALVDVLSR